LHKISPQSPDFAKIIKALKPKFHDIGNWQVEYFFMASHLVTGNEKYYRTVDYWLKHTVNINDTLPEFFYHGTSTNQWYEGIKKNGLLPRNITGSAGGYGSQNASSLSKKGIVYLSTHPDAATRTAAEQAANKHGGVPLILKINSSGIFKDKLVPDEDSRQPNAQKSIVKMSTVGYEGRVPPSAIEPFLLGNEYEKNSRLYTKWEKFKDVPVAEHPLTARLKSGMTPYSNDPEYYILRDAGIIKREKTRNPTSGWPSENDVQTREVSDEELRKLLKNGGWANTARAISTDLNNGYQGCIYSLKDITLPPNMSPESESIIKMLTDSRLCGTDTRGEKRYIYLNNYDSMDRVIALAKLLHAKKMDMDDLCREIKTITALPLD
jgi:hypothetical protein